MMTYIFFALGFIVLIMGAKWLVDGAGSIGLRFGLPQIIIGLTIVALGTSLPELVINVFASTEGNTDLAIGNVIGSNIINTLLIVGIAAFIFPIKVDKATINRDLPFNFVITLLLLLLANDLMFGRNNSINRFDGIILLALLAYFLYLTFFKSSAQGGDDSVSIKQLTLFRSVAFIALGMLGLYFGGKWIVEGAEQVATDLGISQSVIGLTLIASATSLPELVTSIIASLKKNSAIAIGNAIGSNIFNILLVLGVSALIKPIPYDSKMNMQVGLLLIGSLLLLLFIKSGKTKRTITRWEGLLMMFGYAAFLYYSIFLQ